MKTIPQKVNELIAAGHEVHSFIVGAMGRIEQVTDDGDLIIKMRRGKRGSLHLNESVSSPKFCIKRHEGQWKVGHRKSHMRTLIKQNPDHWGAVIASAVGL